MLNESAPREPRKSDHGAEVLVRLREEGDRPPLHFIPAGYGDMRAFRNVVALLDDDRPVYGLWPPRVDVIEGLRSKPVHWLVSVYVAEIKRVQPAGPYHLSGYSMGGLIMVEVARALIRKGDAVELLVVFDPPVHVTTWVALYYKGLYKLCNLTPLTDAIRWTIIRRWKSRILRWVSDEGLCTHVCVFQAHEVASYPGRIVFFVPRDSWIRPYNRACIGKSWHKIARDGLDVHWMPGRHHEMMLGNQLEILAAGLNDCLKRSGHP